MKQNLLIKKNKGIAMISVMIAIAFISIVATAMLTISTANYSMKTANVLSKENSYSTDGELTRTTSSIRELAVGSSGNPANIASLLKDTSHYDCTKIAELVYPGQTVTGDATNAVVSIKDPYNDNITDEIHIISKGGYSSGPVEDPSNPGNMLTGVTRYKFEGVTVTRTAKYAGGAEKEIFNSAKSDIVFDIYEQNTPSKVSGGVGNLSLMLDSNFKAGGEQFSFLTMSGNTFVTDYKKNGGSNKISTGFPLDGATVTMTIPGNDAFTLTKQCKVNMCGDYNVVYGDLNLKEDSSLTVHGCLIVYGDINIDKNATLIFDNSGELKFMKSQFPHYDETVRYSQINYTGGATAAKNTFYKTAGANCGDGSAFRTVEDKSFKDFLDHLNYSDSDSNNDGLLYKVLRKDNFFGSADKYVTEYSGNFNGCDSSFDRAGLTKTEGEGGSMSKFQGYRTTKPFNGRNIGVAVIDGTVDTLNGGCHDLLVISCRQPSASAMKMTQFSPNMTVISACPVELGVQHGVVMSKIGSEEFNYITGIKGADSDTKEDYADSLFNNVKINFSSPYTGRVGKFFDKDCNVNVDKAYGYASGGGGASDKQYASTIYFQKYERDSVDAH